MISTHILDTALGKPAQDVCVKLFSEDGVLLGESKTDQDGRVSDFNIGALAAGSYSIEFAIQPYFAKLNTETFFPKTVIYFSVSNSEQHYHIPLLISPYAYSTYRGS
jgi:5-hydroxyisourate hydrolase